MVLVEGTSFIALSPSVEAYLSSLISPSLHPTSVGSLRPVTDFCVTTHPCSSPGWRQCKANLLSALASSNVSERHVERRCVSLTFHGSVSLTAAENRTSKSDDSLRQSRDTPLGAGCSVSRKDSEKSGQIAHGSIWAALLPLRFAANGSSFPDSNGQLQY